jgi:hypothetical protein
MYNHLQLVGNGGFGIPLPSIEDCVGIPQV